MNKHTEAPAPEDSGSDGSQVVDDSTTELVPVNPFAGLTLPAQAIEGLVASNTRVFGGPVGAALLAAITTQYSAELQYTKQQLSDLREQKEILVDQLSTLKTENAVLKERISSYRSNRHLKNFGIAVGTLLFGVGIKFFIDDLLAYGLASSGVGGLLLVSCWLSAPKGGDK